MKNIIKTCLMLILVSTGFATEFSVQGVLRDPLGRTVDNGSYSVIFKIYDEVSGSASALWTETHGSVDVQHGIFSVLLGSIEDMDALSFKTKYWIGISVAGGVEMTPRTQLTTSPYSKAVLGTDNIFPSVGRVGVGTTDPQAAFHVKNKNNETDIFLIKDADGGEQVKVANDGTLSVPDGIFGNGVLGVGTQNPTAALHILSNDDDDKLRIDDENGAPQVQVNSDGYLGINNPTLDGVAVIGAPLSVSGNLRLYNDGVLLFTDGTQLASADFGGSATGVTSPSSATINALSSDGTIALNIGSADKVVVTSTLTDISTSLQVKGNSKILTGSLVGGINFRGSDAWSVIEGYNGNDLYIGTSANYVDYGYFEDLNSNSTLNVTGATTLSSLAVGGTTTLSSLAVTGSGSLSSLTLNGNGNMVIGSASGSFRAPIFYDLNNISYYLDPNGNTNLNSLDVGHRASYPNATTNYMTVKTGSTGYARFYGHNNWTVFGSSGADHDMYIGSSGNYNYGGFFTSLFYGSGSQVSDRKFKENIQALDSEEMLTKLLSLRGVSYDAKENGKLYNTKYESQNKDIIGVIAQEVNLLFPTIAGYREEHDYMTVTYDKFIPVMIESIKQLKKEKDQEMADLKNAYDEKIAALLERVESLENQ